MAYYPTVATVHYKDKHIDIEIPLRIKLILLRKYKCSKCSSCGTAQNIINYCSDRLKDDAYKLKWKQIGIGVHVPTNLYGSNGFEYCPVCYKDHLEYVKLIPVYRMLIKVYYSVPNRSYIKIDKLVENHVRGRWKGNIYENWGNYDERALYFETLKQTYDHFKDEVRTYNKKVKIKVDNKITLKQLKKDYSLYEQRKFVRKL